MDDLEGAVLNAFADKMMLNVNVFSALLIASILREVDRAAVINKNCSRNIFQLQSDLDQHPSQPESLASAMRSGHIFAFGSRCRNGWLLFATPGKDRISK